MFVKKRKYLYIYDVFLCLTFFLSQEPWERPLVWSTRRLRLCGEFKYIVHKHIQQAANGTGLAADQVIYLFTTNGRNTNVKTGEMMSEIYDRYKSDDGFLYIAYSAENTLG
ncbi:Autophagy-related protein 8 (Autophagy-related ubiquitin-like modifier atg8) [Durusdinium trenchii]|uniref:Autophagy-related protein 8 (Autophagy-related ubiquitin-like modifier atg8) n=1 Tax=Durusdinium trenchii TaxID=1381693 RepID=A0ABP0LG05_9DINO